MEAFSIIEIPPYIKTKLKRKLLGVNMDYKRFNIRDREIIRGIHQFSRKASDTDNSDIIYDWEVAMQRIHSPRWIAHNILLSMVGWKPIWFAYMEVYWPWQGLRGSVGRIDFKWSFFHFYDQIPERWKQVYNALIEQEGKIVRTTRKDVAFDFAYEFPQWGDKWINPAKNSKRSVECYKHNGLFNSYGYLAEKNTNYGIRIYNKIIDIEKNSKEFWYWWTEKLPKNWTRIEFEFYPPYSLKSDEELMKICSMRLLGSDSISLWLPYRPCFDFKLESAYSYFTRYALNHWITIDVLLEELVDYHTEQNYKKELANRGEML